MENVNDGGGDVVIKVIQFVIGWATIVSLAYMVWKDL